LGIDKEEDIFFKSLRDGATIRLLQVDDKEEELAMIKRHQFYFYQVKKIGKGWLQNKPYGALWNSREHDIRLFNSRFASELEPIIPIQCDQCYQVFTRFNKCRYRCLVCTDFDICERCYINDYNPKKHSMFHKVVCIRFKCASCKGYIVGTRFNCTVCPDFDLCLGCFDSETYHASHNNSHQMTSSSNIPKDDNETEKENLFDISDPGVKEEVLKD